jgi:hypothetical protein
MPMPEPSSCLERITWPDAPGGGRAEDRLPHRNGDLAAANATATEEPKPHGANIPGVFDAKFFRKENIFSHTPPAP